MDLSVTVDELIKLINWLKQSSGKEQYLALYYTAELGAVRLLLRRKGHCPGLSTAIGEIKLVIVNFYTYGQSISGFGYNQTYCF
jgi:hypothetical protein